MKCSIPVVALVLLTGCGGLQHITAPEAAVEAGVELCVPLIGCHRVEVQVSAGDPPKACIAIGPLRYCTRPRE